MSQPFRFKQFSVNDDRCGQKVGTDSIVLGCWATANTPTRILDIGTGCGLLALMLAQRFPNATITGVEFDSLACEQAEANFRQCPWAHRLTSANIDAKNFTSVNSFDLIVCNPPYFEASLKSDNTARSAARHDDQLTLADLVIAAATHLDRQGKFCVVLPIDRADELIEIAATAQLFLTERCDVRPMPKVALKRSLLAFGWQKSVTPVSNELVLEEARHQYSAGYVELARDFLLKM